MDDGLLEEDGSLEEAGFACEREKLDAVFDSAWQRYVASWKAKQQYQAVAVRLLSAMGDGWLVSGLDTSDAIVVHGAGVLWSLQGISTFSAAEAEHD